MTRHTQAEYTALVRRRYEMAAGRAARGQLLDEYCRTTGLHRKAAIRRLRGRPRSGTGRPRGRPRRYGPEYAPLVQQLWEWSDRPCGRLLAAAVPMLLAAVARHRALRLSPLATGRPPSDESGDARSAAPPGARRPCDEPPVRTGGARRPQGRGPDSDLGRVAGRAARHRASRSGPALRRVDRRLLPRHAGRRGCRHRLGRPRARLGDESGPRSQRRRATCSSACRSACSTGTRTTTSPF